MAWSAHSAWGDHNTHKPQARLIALNHFSVSHDDSGRSVGPAYGGLTVNIVESLFFAADHFTEWLSQS